MRGGTTRYLEFSFWKLSLLIVSAFKGVNFQKRLFTPPLGGILGPFTPPLNPPTLALFSAPWRDLPRREVVLPRAHGRTGTL